MYPSVINVSAQGDYVLSIEFDNGENGELDIKPILDFGVFKKIKDQNEFKKVRVSFDTVEWDCGVDLDPDYVYRKSVKRNR